MGSYNDANVQQNMGLAGAMEPDICYMNLYALQSILDAFLASADIDLYNVTCFSER